MFSLHEADGAGGYRGGGVLGGLGLVTKKTGLPLFYCFEEKSNVIMIMAGTGRGAGIKDAVLNTPIIFYSLFLIV